jgi:hypothetical protein
MKNLCVFPFKFMNYKTECVKFYLIVDHNQQILDKMFYV